MQGLVNWVPGQLLEPDANANQGLGRQRYPETPLTSICEGHPELQDYMVCPQSTWFQMDHHHFVPHAAGAPLAMTDELSRPSALPARTHQCQAGHHSHAPEDWLQNDHIAAPYVYGGHS